MFSHVIQINSLSRYFIFALLFFTTHSYADNTCTEFDNEGYSILKQSIGIYSEYTGASGSRSKPVLAFECLMKSSNRGTLLSELYDEGGNAGKLYALAGFRSVNLNRYYKEKQLIDQEEVLVRTLMGCVSRRRKVSEVIQWIDSGEWPAYSRIVAQ